MKQNKYLRQTMEGLRCDELIGQADQFTAQISAVEVIEDRQDLILLRVAEHIRELARFRHAQPPSKRPEGDRLETSPQETAGYDKQIRRDVNALEVELPRMKARLAEFDADTRFIDDFARECLNRKTGVKAILRRAVQDERRDINEAIAKQKVEERTRLRGILPWDRKKARAKFVENEKAEADRKIETTAGPCSMFYMVQEAREARQALGFRRSVAIALTEGEAAMHRILWKLIPSVAAGTNEETYVYERIRGYRTSAGLEAIGKELGRKLPKAASLIENMHPGAGVALRALICTSNGETVATKLTDGVIRRVKAQEIADAEMREWQDQQQKNDPNSWRNRSIAWEQQKSLDVADTGSSLQASPAAIARDTANAAPATTPIAAQAVKQPKIEAPKVVTESDLSAIPLNSQMARMRAMATPGWGR